MEHPLVNDLSHLSLDELTEKITQLQKQLTWARKTNGHLANQISMILESYQAQYNVKQQELWKRDNRDGNDYSDRIDIS